MLICHCFNIRARGELSRLILNAANVDFEDERIEFDDWPALKPKTLIGTLPYLTVDGKELYQSVTIARYLAKEFGLAGKTNWEQAQADMAIDLVDDMINPLFVRDILFGTDEEKKTTIRQAYEKDKLPHFLTIFEKLLSEKGTGHFAGSELTYADLAVYQGIDFLQRKNIGIKLPLEKYPKLQTFISDLEKSSKVSSYLAKRPAADM